MAETKINNNQLNTPISLFDIKTNSEPITQKGWSCISYPTQNKLDKADVPTAYDFIENKLNGAEGGMSDMTNGNGDISTLIVFDGQYYYYPKNNYIVRSNYLSNTNETNMLSLSGKPINTVFNYTVANNKGYFIGFGRASNWSNWELWVFNENFEQVYYKSQASYPYTTFIGSPNENKIFYKDSNQKLLVIDLDNNEIVDTNIQLTYYCNNLIIFNNFLYTANNYNLFKVNITDYTYITIPINSYAGQDIGTWVLVYQDKICVLPSERRNNNPHKLYQIQNDTIYDTIDVNIPYNERINNLKTYDNEYYFYIQHYNINGDEKWHNIVYKTNFTNFSQIDDILDEDRIYDGIYNLFSNGEYIAYFRNTLGYNYHYSSIVITIYTDTYTINSVDVPIKYYKNGNYKICTPDIAIGNDANLQTVYDYLGYLNYWWIDENNEQITLQRNSNMWTMMYVDDDYIDSSLPIGEYIRNKNLAEYIEISSTSITIANIQANKNYVLSNNAITDITFTACETSMEETTIQFTTGTNAPTLIDNSGLVWFDGIPTLLPNTTYVIVIFNKQAFYKEN